MIYFLVPVYNEQESIRGLILEIRRIFAARPYKIVAVDDGSKDNSSGILRALKADDLVVERFGANRDIGAVFSAGIERILSDSQGSDDVMVIIESDQTSPVTFVDRILSGISEGGADIVIASRYKRGGGYCGFPLTRRIFSLCANRLMGLCFPVKGVSDYTIFFRGYRISLVRKAFDYFGAADLITSRGFVANAELLVKLSLFTRRISEVPFVYNYARKSGRSKIRVGRTLNEYLRIIGHLRRVIREFTRR